MGQVADECSAAFLLRGWAPDIAHHGLVGHSEYVVVVVVLWVVRQGCRGQDGERGTRGEGERRGELTRSDDM